MKTLIKQVYQLLITKCPPIGIIINFVFQVVLADYGTYAHIKRRYGLNCTILGTAMRGTGDYYISGLYLQSWLNKNKISDFVFLYGGSSEREVAELFNVLKGKLYKSRTIFTIPSNRICAFLGTSEIDMFWFHAPSLTHSICGVRAGNTILQGYKGLNMLDWYMLYTMCPPRTISPQLPERFVPHNIDTTNMFPVSLDKVILIAPYSHGNITGQIPDDFWNILVKSLTEQGYTVFTNCVKDEAPLPNTEALFLPYEQTVPFLNRTAGFIGIRSGLCDVVSSSVCKKIIVHTHKSYWWPDGHSILYTGLRNMGLCNESVEFEYSGLDDISLILSLFERGADDEGGINSSKKAGQIHLVSGI